MYQFDYVRAASVSEAASALAANPEAKLIAGGQTLLPTLKQRLAQPASVVDLGAIGELKSIRKDGTYAGHRCHGNPCRGCRQCADVAGAIPAICQARRWYWRSAGAQLRYDRRLPGQ